MQSPAPACRKEANDSCPRCGRLPGTLHTHGIGLVLWPPTGHVRGRIAQLAAREGVALVEESDSGALVWACSDEEAIEGFVSLLKQELSSVERADVRVFLGEPGRFGLSSGRDVVSLDDAHAKLRADWLLCMLREERFSSWMQPIFLAADGTLAGYEFLLRGVDEAGAIVSPGLMFDMARRADLLFQLDLAARRSAIQTAARYAVESRLFINFTPNAVYDPAFCLRTTVELIEEAGIRPEQVVFEVTEADKEHDTEHLQRILCFYRSRGFRIALDDVGAGFASLNRIHKLEPDIIKIDMALVRGADTDAFKRTLSTKLIESAQELGIEIVAEGIETQAEHDLFKRLGVTWMQGWHLGRPSPGLWARA